MENKYYAITGCYGATRGTTVAAIANEVVRNLTQGTMKVGKLEILIDGVGSPDKRFMPDDKVNHPVKKEWLEAIARTGAEIQDKLDVSRVVNYLEGKGRQKATKEQLEAADAVYTADSFILGSYAKEEGRGTAKYQTMLQGADLRHEKFGADMDDVEASNDFVARRIAPLKIKAEPVGDPNPKNAKFYSLSGKEYTAGSQEAIEAHARDVWQIGYRLGMRIYYEAKQKAGISS